MVVKGAPGGWLVSVCNPCFAAVALQWNPHAELLVITQWAIFWRSLGDAKNAAETAKCALQSEIYAYAAGALCC